MMAVFKGAERIGSLLKVRAVSRPWYAYADTGKGENFRTRKEAITWLETQSEGDNGRHDAKAGQADGAASHNR